jgi:putative lipoprotein
MLRFLVLGFCCLAACAAQVSGQVKGTATYRERTALPPDAVFEATLEDVSKADARAEVIGRTRIDRPGNPPIAFEIRYDASRIDPARRYAVRARILAGGKLFFTTDRSYPVLTGGQGSEVALLLRRVGGAEQAGAAAPLENTYWRLVSLGDVPLTGSRGPSEPHFFLQSDSRRVSGSAGCNAFAGSYELKDDRLSFRQVAATTMACAEGMETETAFLAALREAASHKVARQRLELFDSAGNPLAGFEARQRK